jgi:hypothetical protein
MLFEKLIVDTSLSQSFSRSSSFGEMYFVSSKPINKASSLSDGRKIKLKSNLFGFNELNEEENEDIKTSIYDCLDKFYKIGMKFFEKLYFFMITIYIFLI